MIQVLQQQVIVEKAPQLSLPMLTFRFRHVWEEKVNDKLTDLVKVHALAIKLLTSHRTVAQKHVHLLS